MSERQIDTGFGHNVNLVLASKPPEIFQPEAVETLDIGSPNLRTTWNVNSISIQSETLLKTEEVAVKKKRKAIVLLEIAALIDNVPLPLTILKHEFKENQEEEESGEKVTILESITPFTVVGGHDLGLSLKLKGGKPFFLLKNSYKWELINPKVVLFIDQTYAGENLSRNNLRRTS